MSEHAYQMPEGEKQVLRDLPCDRGDTLRIELPAIPSTGYTWELDDLPDGTTCLGQYFKPSEGRDPEIVGAGGIDVWTFKVREVPVPGWERLGFGLRRVWEDEQTPARVCLLDLRVSETVE